MGRFEYISDADVDDWARSERDRELSKVEEYIQNMEMSDVEEFLTGLRPTTELMRAIKDEDEHEFGSVIFDALRKHAKDATT